MYRWGKRFFLLQHEEGARDSYTGRNKHLETPHILSACCWVFPEFSQRPISSWEHLKTPCQAQPQVTKNLPTSTRRDWTFPMASQSWHSPGFSHTALLYGSRINIKDLLLESSVFQWLVEYIWHTECARVFLTPGETDWKGQKRLLSLPNHMKWQKSRILPGNFCTEPVTSLWAIA